ncbi:MAG: hypothetical protein ACLUDK_12760 [Clostridium paraputrificum]
MEADMNKLIRMCVIHIVLPSSVLKVIDKMCSIENILLSFWNT